MEAEQIHRIGGRRAWLVWGVAVSVYLLAVLHRSSLGVAGLLATERFDIAASQLAFFTVLQLIVYAGMQVPVGVLLDRFGPRALLCGGLVLMTAAQFAFAYADSFGLAAVARGFVGAGDAMVFVTVVRLVAVWFRPTQVPMTTQLTGWVGQLGAIAAAAPLTLLLDRLGWTGAFAAVSTIGVFLLVAVLVVVKDSPYAVVAEGRESLRQVIASVGRVWSNPGTRLGFWVHFTTQFPFTVFVLLWGFPFLVRGQGWSEVAASTLLMAMTGWVVLSGIVIGSLTTRLPFHRTRTALVVVLAEVVLWSIVLLLDGPAPVWLILLTAAATASGGPSSVIGFDIVRTFTPVRAVGRATSLVNVGGFVASLVTVALIGIVLDLVEPAGAAAYDLGDFRIAFLSLYLCWVIGLVQMFRLRRLARAHLDQTQPGALDVLRSGRAWLPDEQRS
ncbi:MFS transporter [Nocardioides jishulii]|uniref:MFS transporter n=1 Tax=Nocardioides jishulii TaxID=2575440 RepID=A0A4U2YSL7_9ACTN|nr:MFS transporter [Nocardioides jishulii]QCX28649.1 MFS transporter [Nocardioides jishulii]TKI64458.1 MFS transporter [Nocardioides jishulii]